MLFILLYASLQIHALAHQLDPHAVLDHDFLANISLMAPLFHSISMGPAWIVPTSFDVGARSMSCECFDPSREHRESSYGLETTLTGPKKRAVCHLLRLLLRSAFHKVPVAVGIPTARQEKHAVEDLVVQR